MTKHKELYDAVNQSVHRQLSKRLQHEVDAYIDMISADIVNEIIEKNDKEYISQQYIDHKVKGYINALIRQQSVASEDINEDKINSIIYKLNSSIESMDLTEDDSKVLVYHLSELIEVCFQYMTQLRATEDILFQDKSQTKTKLLKLEIEKKKNYIKSNYEFLEEDEESPPVISKSSKADIIQFPANKKSHP